jgi:outer membrane cobalamin receptor
MTSFVLADFLTDNGCFGADAVVISSASAKTSYGTAFHAPSLSERFGV